MPCKKSPLIKAIARVTWFRGLTFGVRLQFGGLQTFPPFHFDVLKNPSFFPPILMNSEIDFFFSRPKLRKLEYESVNQKKRNRGFERNRTASTIPCGSIVYLTRNRDRLVASPTIIHSVNETLGPRFDRSLSVKQDGRVSDRAICHRSWAFFCQNKQGNAIINYPTKKEKSQNDRYEFQTVTS